MVETILFTAQQLKVLAILPIISGPLSLLGSTLILLKIFRERKKRLSQTYHRILLGFSTLDIIGSFAYCFSTLPSPIGTPNTWGARGNDATCSAQGFFLVIGTGIIFYNAALVIYYVLTICFNVPEVVLRKHYDPWVHRFVLLFSLIPSVLGVILGMINNVGNVCFIGDYPVGCASNDEVECERGQNYFLFSIVTFGWAAILTCAIVPICMVLILLRIKKQDDKMKKKYEFRPGMSKYSSVISRGSSNLPSSSADTSVKVASITQLKRRKISLLGKVSGKTKQVRTQALMYATASVLCLWWPIIIRLNVGGGHFIIRCLAQFFYPLLGFFNFISYTRPRALKLVENGTAKSTLHAFYLAAFVADDKVKRLHLQRKAQLTAKRVLKPIENSRNNDQGE